MIADPSHGLEPRFDLPAGGFVIFWSRNRSDNLGPPVR